MTPNNRRYQAQAASTLLRRAYHVVRIDAVNLLPVAIELIDRCFGLSRFMAAKSPLVADKALSTLLVRVRVAAVEMHSALTALKAHAVTFEAATVDPASGSPSPKPGEIN